jgi:ferritin
MLSKKLAEALNKQINAEFYSAYLYYSMSSYFTSKSLRGFANWTTVQAQEEMTHAIRLYNYVNNSGGRALMQAIEAPPTEWKSPLEVFREIYKHEVKVTGMIHKLLTLATEEKSYPTMVELQWFVTEQVEEEASADEIVRKLELMEGAPGGLFMIDQQLAQRVFVMPPWLGGGQGA